MSAFNQEDFYVIRSGINPSITLKPVQYDWSNPADSLVEGTKNTGLDKWRFLSQGGSLYKVTLASDEPVHLTIKSGQLMSSRVGEPTDFCIEPANNNLWRIYIMNTDLTLRLDAGGSKVKPGFSDGTVNELWYIEPWSPSVTLPEDRLR